jgi:hypothetical protein
LTSLQEEYPKLVSIGSINIEEHIDKAKTAVDIGELQREVAILANVAEIMSQHEYLVWQALCQRYRDWRGNLETGK